MSSCQASQSSAGTTKITVGPTEHGMRLDAFLSRFDDISRSRAKKIVEEGLCLINGKPCLSADSRVVEGAELEFSTPELFAALKPEEGELDIIYRDEHFAVINKPVGLTVHPCPSCPEGTLAHRLLAHFPELAQMEGQRPGIVHRLDKDTSGIMLAALDETARLALSEAFAEREVGKTYLALTRGVPPRQGQVNQPIGRHPTLKTKMAVVPEERGGKPALTEWHTLYADPARRFALLAVDIHTGRTHQIRVHLTHIGHPLWGDTLYAPRDRADPAPRQMLHAWKLAFMHPVSGKPLTFQCPPPADFVTVARSFAIRPQRVVITGTPGCGKSALLKTLEARGLPVWSADKVVAELHQPGADGWTLLRQRYGERFLLPLTPQKGTGKKALPSLDKSLLTQAMIDNPALRSEIEHMLHPLIYASLALFWQRNASAELTVAEVPLWFETAATSMDSCFSSLTGYRFVKAEDADIVVVTVACPTAIRHARLRATRDWDDARIAAVDSWQWLEEEKIKASALAVDNSGSEADLVTHADNLLARLHAMREEEAIVLDQQLQVLWGESE